MQLDRFRNVEDWERRISQSYFPLLMNRAQTDFEASIATVDLPRGIRISKVEVEANHLKRTSRLVRTQQSGHVLVLFQHAGKAIMRQADREVLLQNGSAAIADPSEPYEVKMTHGSHQMVILVPAASIRSAGATIPDVRTRLLTGNSLATKSLSSIAAEIVDKDAQPEEAEGLAAACLDLLRGALGRLGASPGPFEEASREAQRRLIEEYIHRHLADPGLSVEAVAKAHRISPRHLATLFGSNMPPGAFVRQARLQRIFDDLTNPDLAGMTAAEIASRWGVEHYPTLSRAFRREFGLTPVEARSYGRSPRDDK